jgi:hypothetical protein
MKKTPVAERVSNEKRTRQEFAKSIARHHKTMSK